MLIHIRFVLRIRDQISDGSLIRRFLIWNDFEFIGCEVEFPFALGADAVVPLNDFKRSLQFESVVEDGTAFGAENLLWHKQDSLVRK